MDFNGENIARFPGVPKNSGHPDISPDNKYIIFQAETNEGNDNLEIYIMSMDGTGLYSSSNISCPECCIKHKGKDNESYYHQLLAAVMVHPDKKTVLPFYPETITYQDGDNKNDCEHNASARLIPQLHKDFPRAEFIVLQDALACNGPHIKRLKD